MNELNQARWRDRSVKLKEKGEIASLKDLADFVVSAAESANDPVFGVQALRNSKERHKDSTKRDGKQNPLPTYQTSNSFAPSIATPSGSEAVENVCGDNPGTKANLCPFCKRLMM